MQTSTPATSVFSSVRVTLIDRDKMRAMVSVVIANAMMVTGIRVIEGTKGFFVSMPQRKSPSGEYSDVAFPISKEMRLELSALILAEFERVSHAATSPGGV